MIKKIFKFIPQPIKNYGEHLPKAIFANLIYGFPSKGMKIIGVTGTDGKTTTTNMIYQILKDAGKKVTLVSTINAVIDGKNLDTGFHVTNPDSLSLQKYISLAKKSGSEYLVLEVTSHGLDQFRVWGIKFDIGVITNITHEHLDYHKNFENYFNTKAKLLKNVRVAILNQSDRNFERLTKMTNAKIYSFGPKDSDFSLEKFPLNLKIIGDYNLENAMAALAVGVSLGIDENLIKKSLENFDGLEGRMEEIINKKGIKIYVDFAHTPNALENALKSLRDETSGKLISVFGAASERDVEKRPLMGQVSGELSDVTILTDEDPRFEDSMKIIDEIAAGVETMGGKLGISLYKIPDRREAIKKALGLAKKSDVIGIFGKGHEKSMNYKGKEIEWSDREVVLDSLRSLEQK